MSSAFKEVKLGLKPKLGQQYSRNTAVITITAINSSNKYFEEYFPYFDGLLYLLEAKQVVVSTPSKSRKEFLSQRSQVKACQTSER